MTALSVSISANTSPTSTLSPTFFRQELMTPDSIVGLKLGMRSTLAIPLTPSTAECDARGSASRALRQGAGPLHPLRENQPHLKVRLIFSQGVWGFDPSGVWGGAPRF